MSATIASSASCTSRLSRCSSERSLRSSPPTFPPSRGSRPFSFAASSRCRRGRATRRSRLACSPRSPTPIPASARRPAGSLTGNSSLTGAEDDAGRIGTLNDLLTGSGAADSRAAVLAAIGRNGRLSESPVIKAAIRSLLTREDAAADLLPILGRPEFTNPERLSVIDRGWKRISPQQRITALDLLFAQPALVNQVEPTDADSRTTAARGDRPVGLRPRASPRRHQRSTGVLVKPQSEPVAPGRAGGRYSRDPEAGPGPRRIEVVVLGAA